MKNQRVVFYQDKKTVHYRIEEETMVPLDNHSVRIKVLAAGVAMAELLMLKGIYPGMPTSPFTPGYEAVGLLEEIGKEVTHLKKGQRVGILTSSGGYTQYIDVPSEKVLLLPNNVNMYVACAVMLNYTTAYHMLHRTANVNSEKDTILIHGISGGVGTALYQLSRLAGLNIYGTASKMNPIKFDGATVIDYRCEDFVQKILDDNPKGIDVVFDGVGGYNWLKSYQVLKNEGKFVGYGMTSLIEDTTCPDEGRFFMNEWTEIVRTGKTQSGHNGAIFSISHNLQEDYALTKTDILKIITYLSEYKLFPKIAATFSLWDVDHAFELLEKNPKGKILLLPNG